MIWSFIIACVLVEITPGPNMTWLAVMGATRGRATALAAVAGIAIGLTVAATVAGVGLSALLVQFPKAFEALRWIGTLYLFYLAYDAWRDSTETTTAQQGSIAQAFTQGLISNILNPKAYLFYGAMLPRFMDAAQPAQSQLITLSAIYVAIATAIHAAIAIASGSFADWLATSRQAVLVRKALAVLIAIAAVWFFYSTKVSQ